MAQQDGDLLYAVLSYDRLVTLLLAAGDSLGDVQREAENGLEFARKAKIGCVADIITGQLNDAFTEQLIRSGRYGRVNYNTHLSFNQFRLGH